MLRLLPAPLSQPWAHPHGRQRSCPALLHWAVQLALVAGFGGRQLALGAPTFVGPITNGTVDIAGLSEASGVAASRNNDQVLWTHNDSGHPPQVFAIDTQGRLLGTYTVSANTDNEDIGIGPGPVTNVLYLYVGDIGDNNSDRPNIRVYQIPEPAVYARQYANPVTAGMKGARTITLQYPDGARNAESLFVDPVTGDFFICTKETTSRLYTVPKSQMDTNDAFTLTFVRTINFSTPSGADITPSGNEIVVRKENVASLWLRAPGQSISNAFDGTVISVPVTGTANGEPNGEAIGYDAIGSGYFTLSDSATIQPLRYFARTSNDGPGPAPRVLVPAGSTWKYLDNGSDQGTAWRNPAFDDSAWKTGSAQFGYGEGDEQTVLSYGSNPNGKYITTYFRTTFVVDDPADITNLTAKLVVSHGAGVFLNGTAALYDNLAATAAYTTTASPMPVALQSTWQTYSLSPSLLTLGTNTLAVEVHQYSVLGTNLSFDLQLLAAGRNPIYEPFDYPPGTPLVLLTNSTGEWWTTAGGSGSTATVATASLSVNGLHSATGGSAQFGAVDGPSARFNLQSDTTNGTLFYSLALKVTSLGALSTAGGVLAGFNNSRGSQSSTPTVFGTRIMARATGIGGFNLGTGKNSGNSSDWAWSPQVFMPGQTIFLVGSYTFNPGSSTNDVSMLWINPDPATFGSASPPPATLMATNGADIAANQIASFVFLQRGLNNVNQPGMTLADELRIDTTWASVTPPGQFIPTLSILPHATNVVLSWPTNAGGFLLESAPQLNPTSLWSQVPGPVSVVNGRFTLTNGLGPAPTFFRLRKGP